MFEVGDKVKRKADRMCHWWERCCAENGFDVNDTFTVSKVQFHTIVLLGMNPLDFTRATPLDFTRATPLDFTRATPLEWDGNNFDVASILIHDGRECTLISQDVPNKGTIIGYYNDTKEVFVQMQKTDWSKVPVDAKVRVRAHEDGEWILRHFSHFDGRYVYVFCDGKTSFTKYNDAPSSSWNFAELVEE